MPKTCNFIKRESLAQVFSCEFCEISKNTFVYRTAPGVASARIFLQGKNTFCNLCSLSKVTSGYFSSVKCPDSFTSSSEYRCRNDFCIDRKYLCDGDDDCVDGDDELSCNTRTCQPNEFRCSNGKCIMERWVKAC